MLLQDVPTVFDTDVMRPLVDTAQSVTGKRLRHGRPTTTRAPGRSPTTPAP